MNSASEEHQLPDTNQGAFSLAAIQLTGMTSLPVLTTSILILQNNNLFSAILCLVLGNILLWLIRLGIVAMGQGTRKSTLDVAKDYTGPVGGYFIAIILLLSTLAWFIAQTALASNSLSELVPLHEGKGIDLFIQFSVALGIISTLLCMEGIIALRWMANIIVPILLVAFLVVIFAAPHGNMKLEFSNISLAGLPLVLATNLGVTADIPTFFRHSRSWKSSVRALAIIQIANFLVGVGGLYLGSVINPWIGININSGFILTSETLRYALIVLIFFSSITANVANVYSASVGWELVAPILAGRKEYLILGLGLTTIYILVGDVVSMDFALNVADSSLVNLCILLIFGFVIHSTLARPPERIEKVIYLCAWLLATVFTLGHYFGLMFVSHPPLWIGLITIGFVIMISLTVKLSIDAYSS